MTGALIENGRGSIRPGEIHRSAASADSNRRLRSLAIDLRIHGLDNRPVIAVPRSQPPERPVWDVLLTYARTVGVDRRWHSGQRLLPPAAN